MNGLHILADLYRCQCNDAILLDRASLEHLAVTECRTAGLTPLGTFFHQFTHPDGKKAGVTGTVVLAESHLAIHTWPETTAVTIDIYVCNFSRDNSGRAQQLYRRLIANFAPEDSVAHRVHRGHLIEPVDA